jgi:hypothetical protein
VLVAVVTATAAVAAAEAETLTRFVNAPGVVN